MPYRCPYCPVIIGRLETAEGADTVYICQGCGCDERELTYVDVPMNQTYFVNLKGDFINSETKKPYREPVVYEAANIPVVDEEAAYWARNRSHAQLEDRALEAYHKSGKQEDYFKTIQNLT